MRIGSCIYIDACMSVRIDRVIGEQDIERTRLVDIPINIFTMLM